jgi:hypothetical protein
MYISSRGLAGYKEGVDSLVVDCKHAYLIGCMEPVDLLVDEVRV